MQIPQDRLAGLKQNWRTDLLSGFIIFLIALPLSLGIAMASGVPPMSGIIAAIVGGLIVSMISGSYVTINGPAAGLIVIILGGIETLGQGNVLFGYTAMLAAIACAGLILAVSGLLKAGTLGNAFPASAVHGMLSAIGLIIFTKQVHTIVGVVPIAKRPIPLLLEIPHSIAHLNPEIAVIGITSLAILLLLPRAKTKWIRMLPAPMVAVLVGIGLGYWFDLEHQHFYLLPRGGEFPTGPQFLVNLPQNILSGITFPNWSLITTSKFWGVVAGLALVQGLETVLSSSAVDRLDPYRRKTNLNRDLSAVGVGTFISGLIGGLPMIAEIVRSSANIANGAKTRWANFFHGLFILLFVAIFPGLIHHIPLACLGAILTVTGYRLASPRHFETALNKGRDQLAVFTTTLTVTLFTDLIIGILSGIAVKLAYHIYRGAHPLYLFRIRIRIEDTPQSYRLHLKGAAIFTNYLGLKKAFDKTPLARKVILDLNETRLIDHSVMEKIHEFKEEYSAAGGSFEFLGLETMRSLSKHPLAARTRPRKLRNSV